MYYRHLYEHQEAGEDIRWNIDADWGDHNSHPVILAAATHKLLHDTSINLQPIQVGDDPFMQKLWGSIGVAPQEIRNLNLNIKTLIRPGTFEQRKKWRNISPKFMGDTHQSLLSDDKVRASLSKALTSMAECRKAGRGLTRKYMAFSAAMGAGLFLPAVGMPSWSVCIPVAGMIVSGVSQLVDMDNNRSERRSVIWAMEKALHPIVHKHWTQAAAQQFGRVVLTTYNFDGEHKSIEVTPDNISSATKAFDRVVHGYRKWPFALFSLDVYQNHPDLGTTFYQMYAYPPQEPESFDNRKRKPKLDDAKSPWAWIPSLQRG